MQATRLCDFDEKGPISDDQIVCQSVLFSILEEEAKGHPNLSYDCNAWLSPRHAVLYF